MNKNKKDNRIFYSVMFHVIKFFIYWYIIFLIFKHYIPEKVLLNFTPFTYFLFDYLLKKTRRNGLKILIKELKLLKIIKANQFNLLETKI